MFNNKYRKLKFNIRAVLFIACTFALPSAMAQNAMWTFSPLSPTTISLPANGTATVQYRVTNQSKKIRTLVMQPIQGVTQITNGVGFCKNPFVLADKDSCILSLEINGSQLTDSIMDGPVVCHRDSILQCYRPSSTNIMRISLEPPVDNVVISVAGSPLTLTANGAAGQLTITNTSTEIAATNISSDFTGTALDGKVTETGNTCASVAPGGSCILTFTPGNTAVAQTDFTIQGSNTNALTAAIEIQSGSTLTNVNPNNGTASGGTGVTLTGTGLTGATAVRFGGVAATSVNVVNSTTVTAVTPVHAIGAVDVVIDTPAGGATLSNGYTYATTAVGQPSGGGVIGCLSAPNNLIVSSIDVSVGNNGISWGGSGTIVGSSSLTDGATNTALIVATLGANGGSPYEAQLCDQYEVDSQGNTPCQAGNTCYNDWFLPAGGSNITTSSSQLYCIYVNRVAIGIVVGALPYYASSSEYGLGNPATTSWFFDFSAGNPGPSNKTSAIRVRCTRAFTP